MTSSTEPLTDRAIGQRLRTARQVARLRQADAAEAIRVARTTLVAIEQGRRRIRTRELQELAFLYGTSANAILRRDAVHLDLVPRFRRLPRGADRATDDAARLLTDLVSAEVELENALGVERHRNYPRERRILPGDVRAQAEQDAQDLRVWLGLGAASAGARPPSHTSGDTSPRPGGSRVSFGPTAAHVRGKSDTRTTSRGPS